MEGKVRGRESKRGREVIVREIQRSDGKRDGRVDDGVARHGVVW